MKRLVDFVMATKFQDLPDYAVHETKRCLLDSIGCAIGAPRMEHGRICFDLGKKLGGQPESTILGAKGKVSCLNAAFTNGELINTLDYDCVFGTHLPPFVIPAPLALAEAKSASGRDTILAVALGHEVAVRLQQAVSPTYWPKESGPECGKILYTDVSGMGTGVFGAAVGAGIILKLNADKMASAMGVAGYAGPSSTMRKWNDTVPCRMSKYGPPGFAAEVGVRSALLADMGYYGDTNIFEGDLNYYRFNGHLEWNKEKVVAGLGTTWRCREIHYKKYPTGH